MKPRGPRRPVLLALGILLAWLVGAVVVRLGLDWSDTFPYSEASEWRYLGVAVVALTIAIGGSIASILVFRRASAPHDRRR
ncbi:hypothetical protein AB4Y63_16445 [Leifsonia sp. YAF41]|uniref:hypothetical protein n=1 Tax=Leifsonia sp. YAF41 TaxID=3233086 RepID=UPI003F9D49BD